MIKPKQRHDQDGKVKRFALRERLEA